MAYSNRGATLVDMEELDRAVLDFHKALELDPKLEGPHLGLGRAFQNKNEFDKCGRHYRKAAELGPDNIMVWNHIGTWHHQSGRIDSAIQHYNIALVIKADAIGKVDTYRRGLPIINVDKARSDAFFNRGSAYHKKGCLDKAIEDYENSLKLHQSPNTYCLCGFAWLELKSWSNGLEKLSTANSLGLDVGKLFILRFRSLTNFEMVVGTKLSDGVVDRLKDFGVTE